MNKKTIIASVGITSLALGALAFTFAKTHSFNTALGDDSEYQIVLNADNAPKSSEYSKTVKTAQGNDFVINYTGTHTLTSSYHTVLGSGAYIWNSSSPISHLQSVVVDLDGGSLKVSGGQSSNNLYESYTLTDDGTINFTDDVNYFKVEALAASTKVVSVTLKYTDDCATGSTESAKTISLEGVPSTLEVGKNAVVVPSTNSKGTLEVVSSDPTVANITKTTGKSGTTYKVNALKEGTCKIYATTSNGLKSSETTLKVISVGLPANTVGRTYRATSENEYFKYGYITVYSATSIKYEYEGYSTTGSFYETEDNARIFYMEDDTSYLEITPSSDGSSLEVFGDIFDDSFNLLNTYGNTHTNQGTQFAKYIKATSLTLSKTSTTLDVGAKETLTASVSSNATDVELDWKSSNPSIVSVDNANSKTRTITAVAAGTATITVKDLDSGLTATCEVTVNGKVDVTSVTVSGPNTVVVGKTIQLTAEVAPSNATVKTVTWSTSDKTVATVSSTGVVTGVKAGTATITATCDGVKGTYIVTVTAPSGDETYELPSGFQGDWSDEYGMGYVTVDGDVAYSEDGGYCFGTFEVTYTGHKGTKHQSKDTYRFESADGSLVLDLQLYTYDELDIYVVTDDDGVFEETIIELDLA